MRHYIVLLSIISLLVILTVWMTGIGMVGIFKMAPPEKVVAATIRHLQIVGVSEFLAIVLGVPIGFMATRRKFRFISPLLITTANIGQTVPTLAFIGIAGAFMGMGFETAVVALSVYAILPIIRNTYAGINSINPFIKEAARGMGMTNWQVAIKVELALALPVIIGGIRTSTIVNVGTAAVAGMIGAGGLGELIVTGIAVRVTELILQGAAPTAALAILLDTFWAWLEKALTSPGKKILKPVKPDTCISISP